MVLVLICLNYFTFILSHAFRLSDKMLLEVSNTFAALALKLWNDMSLMLDRPQLSVFKICLKTLFSHWLLTQRELASRFWCCTLFCIWYFELCFLIIVQLFYSCVLFYIFVQQFSQLLCCFLSALQIKWCDISWYFSLCMCFRWLLMFVGLRKISISYFTPSTTGLTYISDSNSVLHTK